MLRLLLGILAACRPLERYAVRSYEWREPPNAISGNRLDNEDKSARSPSGGIDPFVLQLVCGHVERKVRRRQAGRNSDAAITVDSSYLGAKEGMRALTANFYLDSIKRLPQPRLRRRARALCEDGLLTENGRRRSMLKEDLLDRFKLGSESLQLLERTRLLRSEPRHGSFYYEISHDRIAEAIHHNRRWRMPKWEAQGQAPGSAACIPARPGDRQTPSRPRQIQRGLAARSDCVIL
jgi:hypothetical protein